MKDGLIAKSLHDLNDLSNLYCNIINAGDSDLIIKKDFKLGRLTSVEDANEKFDNDVLHFKKLDINELKSSVAKKKEQFTGYSKCQNSKTHDSAKNEVTKDVLDQMTKMRISKKLNQQQYELLFELLLKNKDSFQWNPDDISKTQLVEHCVPIKPDSNPVQQRQYPIHQSAKEDCRQQIDAMFKKKVIRDSNSEWRSPVLLVKKKTPDNKVVYRFCVDLRKVNEVTVKDCYSLPIIGDTVDSLNGCQYFTTMDVDQAFWQVPMKEEDKKKYAFVFEGRLYEFNQMPFGAMNAPSTFQRLIDRVLRGLTWKQCLVYMDDVLVFSKTFEQHLVDLDEVLNRFKFAGLKLKPSKCMFADNEVEYLGFKLSEKGMHATEKKIETVLNLKPPDTNKQLYGFLCSMTYYRMLIPKFGHKSVNLYKMVDTGDKLCKWNEKTLKDFDDLRMALITSPILAYPDWSKPFIVQTDASGSAMAGVLLQEQNGIYKPVAFCGRKYSEIESRYSTSERELLAITYAYEQFEHYLYGRTVDFYTDHEPLVTACKLKKPFGRLARLFQKLPNDHYKIKYIPGNQNHLPDFLSRVYDYETKSIKANMVHMESALNWQEEQNKDPVLRNVIKLLEDDKEDDKSWQGLDNWRRWYSERRNLYLCNGVLKHSNNKIVVPENLKQSILAAYHDAPFAGHRAFETTFSTMKERFFWIHMPSETKAYCYSCSECQRFNYGNIHLRAPMEPIIVYRPFQIIGIDFIGPFLKTENGYQYVVIAIDHFTKFAIGSAMINIDAESTAKFVLNDIICKFGMMENILSDRGANFESHLFQHLCKLLGTNKLRTTAYHPPGNGTTERINKTVKPNIAKYINGDHNNWDEFVQLAISSYNNSIHSSIGISPFEALFGRKPVMVSDVINNSQLPANTLIRNVSDFIINLKVRAFEMNEAIKKQIEIAQAKQKLQYDKFKKDRVVFDIGETVKLVNHVIKERHSKAFTEKFIGPCKIVDRLNDLIFVIEFDTGKRDTIHYNRLRKWHERISIQDESISNSKINNSIPMNQLNEQLIDKKLSEQPTGQMSTLITDQDPIKYISLVKRRRKKQHLPQQIHTDAILVDLTENNLQINDLNNSTNHLEEIRELIFDPETRLNNLIINNFQNLNVNLIRNANEIEVNRLLRVHRYGTRLNNLNIQNVNNQEQQINMNQVLNINDDTQLNLENNDELENNLPQQHQQQLIEEIQPIDIMYNAKGKPMVQCEFCDCWCERKYGIHTHLRSCIVRLNAINNQLLGNRLIEIPIAGEQILNVSDPEIETNINENEISNTTIETNQNNDSNTNVTGVENNHNMCPQQ